MYKYLILSSIVFFTIISCKKNSDNSSQLTLNSTNLADTYKITAATFTLTGSSSEIDVLSDTTLLKNCQKDDYYIFDVTDTFTHKDTGMVCNPADNYKVKYTITQPNILNYNNTNYTVSNLTSTNLVISKQDSFKFSGTTISGTAKLTLTRL